jgi:hypothetical protein
MHKTSAKEHFLIMIKRQRESIGFSGVGGASGADYIA